MSQSSLKTVVSTHQGNWFLSCKILSSLSGMMLAFLFIPFPPTLSLWQGSSKLWINERALSLVTADICICRENHLAPTSFSYMFKIRLSKIVTYGSKLVGTDFPPLIQSYQGKKVSFDSKIILGMCEESVYKVPAKVLSTYELLPSLQILELFSELFMSHS